jgi:hypothetical protein
MKAKGQLTLNFYPKVHVLAGTLVPVVKADSLGGLRANWHHTKPYTRALQEPTQDEGTHLHEQSTRGTFGASPGNKLKNPSQSQLGWP